MPIYEYECNKCGHELETLVRMSVVPGCPSCRSTDLERKLSVFAATGSTAETVSAAADPCGSCGDPRGPGACALN